MSPLTVRCSYRYACPPSPNLVKLRQLITEKLVPVHFFIRNKKLTPWPWVWDTDFMGICCSPKFEGKTHKEINEMVDELAAQVGMRGRVRLLCQPPSRWHMLKRRARSRWDFDR
ncbi:unnamed protein product [Effrenium voratum]|nr:unnamed protein product [Effrenium voratum]CAJ1451894.1 unnamed protein product [Effrenium voratum]